MKPTSLPNQSSKHGDMTPNRASAFAATDCHYHTATLPNFRGGCASPKRSSFRNISGEYFRNEAPTEFRCEMIAFGAIMITAAIPMLSNAHALAHFLRAIGTL